MGKRYQLPTPQDRTTYLARHEEGLFSEAEEKIASLGGYKSHRNQAFDRHILPRCKPLIEAIGHRMAYEAAKEAGVRSEVLDLFQRQCISTDLSWYVERGLIARETFLDSTAEAYNRASPILLHALQESEEMDSFITAPIVSEVAWESFVGGLPTFIYPCNRPGGHQSKL